MGQPVAVCIGFAAALGLTGSGILLGWRLSVSGRGVTAPPPPITQPRHLFFPFRLPTAGDKCSPARSPTGHPPPKMCCLRVLLGSRLALSIRRAHWTTASGFLQFEKLLRDISIIFEKFLTLPYVVHASFFLRRRLHQYTEERATYSGKEYYYV